VDTGYGRVEVRGGRLNGFGFQALPLEIEHERNDNLPWGTSAGRGGGMLYGIIAAVDQISFSNDAELNILDAASSRPPARAPNGASSTR
jgi:hypothetical protein